MSAPLALTIGEPAGIGPDIALAAWRMRRGRDVPTFYVLGDAESMRARAAHIGWDVPIRVIGAATDTGRTFDQALPVFDLGLRSTAQPGRPDASSAPLAIAAIDRAVADVFAGAAAALVTNPVAKGVLYEAGFTEPGHTEYLAKLAHAKTGRAARPVMMLWSPELAVVPVTIHVPIKTVPDLLTADLIAETGQIVAHDLRTRFGVMKPRLAVAGLNPHAGENGAIGEEENTVIRIAIERLRASGIDAAGPLPGDAMFHAAARAAYDAALCMYHDQALIPIKTLAFDHAVNVTLGLPFVRTSPDHGTAFDIAGTGNADPSSLIAALQLAAQLVSAQPRAAAAE